MAIRPEDITEYEDIPIPSMIVYGPHGIGKTSFGAGAPNVIFAQTEQGLGIHRGVKCFPFINGYDKLLDCVDYLIAEEHKYDTLVIDSLDWLEPLVWAHYISKNPKNERGKEVHSIEDYGYGKGYVGVLEYWRCLLEGLDELKYHRGMGVVLLGHSEVKIYQSPETDPYDRYILKLHKRAAALVEEWVDIQLFANFKTHIKQADVGFNKTVARGEGSGQRVLYTEERPAFHAKNRYGLPASLPFTKEKMYEKVLNLIYA